MPIELGIWKIGNKPEAVTFSGIDLEARLEKLLAQDLSLVGPRLMFIGRQVPTSFGKFIDLLAMDAEGELHVIELKRNRTAREAVAQLLDYACWVKSLSRDDIAKIYAEKNGGKLLEQGFADAFETSLPDEINQGQQLVLVAAELDPSSERIINFLADSYGVPINAVYFRYFKDGAAEYLARTWLIDPMPTSVEAIAGWDGELVALSVGGADGSGASSESLRRRNPLNLGQNPRMISVQESNHFPVLQQLLDVAVATQRDEMRSIRAATI